VVSASYDRSVRVWEWREPAVPAVDVAHFTLHSSSSLTSSSSSFHSTHTSTSTHTSNSTHARASIYASDTDGASVVGVADGVVGYRNSGVSEKRGVGRLIREFRDLHASHIFDVKFDVGRIVRWVFFSVFFFGLCSWSWIFAVGLAFVLLAFPLSAVPNSPLIGVPTDRAFLQHFARPEDRCFGFHRRHRGR
jgi:hypothetical protein